MLFDLEVRRFAYVEDVDILHISTRYHNTLAGIKLSRDMRYSHEDKQKVCNHIACTSKSFHDFDICTDQCQ